MARVALRSLFTFVTNVTLLQHLNTSTVTWFLSFPLVLLTCTPTLTSFHSSLSTSALSSHIRAGPCATLQYQTLSCWGLEESTPPFSIWTGPICRKHPGHFHFLADIPSTGNRPHFQCPRLTQPGVPVMPLLMRRKSVLAVDKHNHDVDPTTGSNLTATTSNDGRPKSASNSLHPSAAASTALLQQHPTLKTLPRPASVGGEWPIATSRLSHEIHPDDIAETSTDRDAASRSRSRFSLMKFRNYSESHLSARAKLDAEREKERVEEELPPVPAVTAEGVVPTIVKTAPTMGTDKAEAAQADRERQGRPSLFRKATTKSRASEHSNRASAEMGRPEKKGTSLRWRRGKTSGLEDLHRLSTMHLNEQHNGPPSYGEHSNSALAVPVSQAPDPRVSESSRSDGSSGSGHIYGSTTTTTHTVQTHTTFFKLPRRNKNRNSLFPVPIKLPPPDPAQHDPNEPTTPRASTHSVTPEAVGTPSTEVPALRRARLGLSPP